MKLLLSLIYIYIFINSIYAQLVVNTTFTIAQCKLSTLFQVDQCGSYCGSDPFLKIKYDFETDKYVATTYKDTFCQEKGTSYDFVCSDDLAFIDGNYLVECSKLVSVLDFSQFTLTGNNCPSGGANVQLGKCLSSCDGKYSYVNKVAGEVNGYQIAFSSTSDCKGQTNIYPVFCGSNNERYTTLNNYGVVCQNDTATIPTESSDDADSSSDASITFIAYSILLFSILLNIL